MPDFIVQNHGNGFSSVNNNVNSPGTGGISSGLDFGPLTSLTEKVQQLLNEVRGLTDTLDDLREALEAATKNRDAAEARLNQLRSERQSLGTTPPAERRDQNGVLLNQAEIAQWQAANREIDAAIKEAENEVKQFQASIDAYSADIKTTGEALEKKGKELMKANEELQAAAAQARGSSGGKDGSDATSEALAEIDANVAAVTESIKAILKKVQTTMAAANQPSNVDQLDRSTSVPSHVTNVAVNYRANDISAP